MKNLSNQIGSTWKRWDLHIHTPKTKLADGYDSDNTDVWDTYIDELEKSDVQAFGITDYFSCDGYSSLVEKYEEKYPNTCKVFFPNIEFRLSEAIDNDGNSPHLHVIFNNDKEVCSLEKIKSFLGTLKLHESNSDGASITCLNLNTESDFNSATVSLRDVKNALKDIFGEKKPYLIVFPAKNDGIRSTDTESPRKIKISDEIDRACDGFFGGTDSTEYFLRNNRYEKGDSEPKPVFSGSDAHSFDDLERLTGDVSEFPTTWIKADLTFRGLQQTIFEPEARVFIGDQPDVLIRIKQEATKFISSLKLNQTSDYSGNNGEWFKDVNISFNPELTAIIGNKGSGKSAIADVIGLLGETKHSEHFSFLTNKSGKRRFKQQGFAENFEATLSWESGSSSKKKLSDEVDKAKPELVKYLPQNYFEQLTNDIEIRAFQDEIESVVFSHVETSERMGKATFKELEEFKTTESKHTTSALKTKLRELNMRLVEKEESVKPDSKTALLEQLNLKKREVKALEDSTPPEVPKPDNETEEQEKVSQQINHINEIQESLSKKHTDAVEKLTNFKGQLQQLSSIEQRISELDTAVVSEKATLEKVCSELGLDIETIVSFSKDTSTVTEQISKTQIDIDKLEGSEPHEYSDNFDYKQLFSVKDISRARDYVNQRLKELKDQLSAPLKRYQNYLHKTNDIKIQISELVGEDENLKQGTIKYFERQIDLIENQVPKEIKNLKKNREDLVGQIFQSKKAVLNFYEELKNSVEDKLKVINRSEFNVSIKASFVLDSSFVKNFLNFIDQGRKGPFKGKEDGKSVLEKYILDVDWNNVGSIYQMLEAILEVIAKDGEIEEQLSSTKEFSDFLFSLEYFVPKYELRLGDKNLSLLSPGEKGLLLLVFYLYLDKDNIPLIIDQPEDNLDNDSIFQVLANCIREAKKNRQVILVTHNPNLAVGADAEQILYVKLEKHNNYNFEYTSGAIEQNKTNQNVVRVLEGSKPAFVQRRLKYQI